MIKKSSFIVLGLISFIVLTAMYTLGSENKNNDQLVDGEECSVISELTYGSVDELETYLDDNLTISTILSFKSINELQSFIYDDNDSYLKSTLMADRQERTSLFYPEAEISDFVFNEINVYDGYVAYLYAKPVYLDKVSQKLQDASAIRDSIADDSSSPQEPTERGGMIAPDTFMDDLITDELNSTIAFEWAFAEDGETLLKAHIEAFNLKELSGKPGYYYEIVGYEETGCNVDLYQIRWLEDGNYFFLRVPVEYFEKNPQILNIGTVDLKI
jgi:hypothetical protein